MQLLSATNKISTNRPTIFCFIKLDRRGSSFYNRVKGGVFFSKIDSKGEYFLKKEFFIRMIILHKVILYTPAGLGTWAVQSRVEKSRTGRAGQGRRRPIEAIEVEATQGIREA